MMRRECSRPDSPFQMVWSCLISLIILYFVAESILVTFFVESRIFTQSFSPEYILLIVILVVDVFVTCNRGIYVGGVVSLDRHEVIRQYIRGWGFLADFLSILLISLSISISAPWKDCLRLVIFLRVTDLFRFDNEFFKLIHTRRTIKQLYMLFKLVVAIFFISHVLACIFYYLDLELI